jgi:hypothetical protein
MVGYTTIALAWIWRSTGLQKAGHLALRILLWILFLDTHYWIMKFGFTQGVETPSVQHGWI